MVTYCRAAPHSAGLTGKPPPRQTGEYSTARFAENAGGTDTVSFEGRAVEYGFGELDELVLAYATTIHKAQGSEYPVVVIPLATQHYAMLARNLLYTGVTRGKRLVVIVGQQKALGMAVRNNGARRRWTKLREWLRPDLPTGSSRHGCTI